LAELFEWRIGGGAVSSDELLGSFSSLIGGSFGSNLEDSYEFGGLNINLFDGLIFMLGGFFDR